MCTARARCLPKVLYCPLPYLISPPPQRHLTKSHQLVPFVSLSLSFSRFSVLFLLYPPGRPITSLSQQDMAESSAEPRSNIRKRRWNRNIAAIFEDLWRQHKRERPLLRAPGVRESFIAIVKASCKYLTACFSTYPLIFQWFGY